jgi:signal transduction histidine kinase
LNKIVADADHALRDTTVPLRPAITDAEVARWAIDTGEVRPLLESIATSEASADWVDAVLTGARVADVNQEVVRRVGSSLAQDEMLGRPVAAFWPSESRTDLAEMIVEVARDNSPQASRTRRISSILFREPDLTVWRSAANHPDRVFVEVAATGLDNRSSWALRASEERYCKLIHHLPLALIQVDARRAGEMFDRLRAQGVRDLDVYLEAHPELIGQAVGSARVTEVNHSAARLLGADSGAALIGPLAPLFATSPGTARRVMVAHFERRRSYAEAIRLRTLDGRMLDVRLSVTFPTPPEQLDVTLISLEDFTDRNRTEAQLRQLEAEFSRAARISTLGELATSIAHEVNQPLAAILTNAETSLRWLARDDPNLEKVVQLTSRIAESAERASEIVQRIRGMAAKPTAERSSIDLNALAEEALLFVRHDLEARSIDLTVDLNRSIPAIYGDRIQLQQVIVNLMVNSIQAIIQAATVAGAITLSTGTGNRGGAFLEVRDNGHGIAEQDLERIFDGFFTTKADGIGIGLAICQSILVAHGGGIDASNTPEGGASFRLWCPPSLPPILPNNRELPHRRELSDASALREAAA